MKLSTDGNPSSSTYNPHDTSLLESLPVEILLRVIAHVGTRDPIKNLTPLTKVNRRFRRLTYDRLVWSAVEYLDIPTDVTEERAVDILQRCVQLKELKTVDPNLASRAVPALGSHLTSIRLGFFEDGPALFILLRFMSWKTCRVTSLHLESCLLLELAIKRSPKAFEKLRRLALHNVPCNGRLLALMGKHCINLVDLEFDCPFDLRLESKETMGKIMHSTSKVRL